MAQGTFDKEIMDAILEENAAPTVPPVTQDQIMKLYNSRVQEKGNAGSWVAKALDAIGLGDTPYALPDRVVDGDTPAGTVPIDPRRLSDRSPNRQNNRPPSRGISDTEADPSNQLPMYKPSPGEQFELERRKLKRT